MIQSDLQDLYNTTQLSFAVTVQSAYCIACVSLREDAAKLVNKQILKIFLGVAYKTTTSKQNALGETDH